jgi:hypothetical protein
MRVDPDPREGELGHVGAADEDRAGGTQAGDDRGVMLGRRRVVERFRPGQGLFAGDVEQILYRDRQSGERRGDIPGLAQLVLRVGRSASGVGVDLDEGARAFAGRIGNPRQRRLDQRAAGGAPGRKVRG